MLSAKTASFLVALALLAGTASTTPLDAAGSNPDAAVTAAGRPAILQRLADLVGHRLQLMASRHAALVSAAENRTFFVMSTEREAAMRGIWDGIKEILEKIINFLKLFMDPIPLGDFDFKFDDDTARGNLSLKALSVSHVKEAVIETYGIHPLDLCAVVTIRLPHLAIFTLYDLDVTVAFEEDGDDDFRLFGSGPAQLDFWNTHIRTDVCISLWGFSVKVARMKISVEKDLVDIKNLLGGGKISDLISGIATDIIPAFVEDYQSELTNFIMNTINNFIASHLVSREVSEQSHQHSSSHFIASNN